MSAFFCKYMNMLSKVSLHFWGFHLTRNGKRTRSAVILFITFLCTLFPFGRLTCFNYFCFPLICCILAHAKEHSRFVVCETKKLENCKMTLPNKLSSPFHLSIISRAPTVFSAGAVEKMTLDTNHPLHARKLPQKSVSLT